MNWLLQGGEVKNQGSIGDRECGAEAPDFDIRRSTLRDCPRHGFRTFGRITDPSIYEVDTFSQKEQRIRCGSVDLYLLTLIPEKGSLLFALLLFEPFPPKAFIPTSFQFQP